MSFVSRPSARDRTHRSPELRCQSGTEGSPPRTNATRVPSGDGTTWFSISGPKGVPDAIVQKFNAELAVLLRQPDVVEKMKEEGLIPIIMDVPTLLAYYQSETKRWHPIVKAAGLKVE